MSDSVTITIQGLAELASKLDALGGNISNALSDAVTGGALVVQNAAKQNAPKKRTNLERSIHTEVTESDDVHAIATVGTDVVYAAIQEFGGTIVPKTAGALAIPLDDTAENYAPRDYPEPLHIQGHALCDAAGVAHYALMLYVTIPPHPYLRPALDENHQDIMDAMTNVLNQVINQAGS